MEVEGIRKVGSLPGRSIRSSDGFEMIDVLPEKAGEVGKMF